MAMEIEISEVVDVVVVIGTIQVQLHARIMQTQNLKRRLQGGKLLVMKAITPLTHSVLLIFSHPMQILRANGDPYSTKQIRMMIVITMMQLRSWGEVTQVEQFHQNPLYKQMGRN